MSTVRISDLPANSIVEANTSNTIFVGVDLYTGVTGKMTANTLARGLYINEPLIVGARDRSYWGNVVAQFSAYSAYYVQTSLQNRNDLGTADVIITANTGTDNTYFIDMGYTNNAYNPLSPQLPGTKKNSLGTAIDPLSGYLFVQGNSANNVGGNLVIGTTSSNTEIRFIAGGYNSTNVVAKITADGFKMLNGHPIYFPDGTTQSTNSISYSWSTAVNTAQNTNIQSAWTTANAAFPTAGGTVTGNTTFNKDVIVGGNLIITGNLNSLNVQSFAVADPLLVLGLGNYVSDTRDIGFAGHYNDGTVNAHAGIIRDSVNKEFYIFKGYTPELDSNNNVIITDPSFSTANLNANVFKGNLIASSVIINGLDLYNSSFNAAANTVFLTGGLATANANTVFLTGVNTTQNSWISSNSAYSNSAFAQANSAGANTVYITGGLNTANASITYTQGVDATQNSWINSNTAYLLGALAVANANTVFLTGALTTVNTYTQGVDATQNTWISSNSSYGIASFAQANSANLTAQAAFLKANNALANTTGSFNGSLTILGDATTTGNLYSTYMLQFGVGGTGTSGTIRTIDSSTSPKDINIIAGNSLGASNGGSINITAGSASLGNYGGSINLTANTSNAAITLSANTIRFNNSTFSPNAPFVQITASNNYTTVAPSNTNYMLQVTGKANSVTRVVIDSFGQNTYPVVVGRMGRGSADLPTATQNNDVMMRIVGNGYTGTQFPASSPTKIDFVAAENITDLARGTQIQFWNTPTGSNTIQKVATFNADSATFIGVVNPTKGFIYTPLVYPAAQTAITIDFANNSMVRAQTATGLVVAMSNYTVGKIVELWITNTAGTNQTYTTGVTALNSTLNATTYNIPGTSTICARYFCVDGTLANTLVSVIHA